MSSPTLSSVACATRAITVRTACLARLAPAAEKPEEERSKFLYLEGEDVATPGLASFVVSEEWQVIGDDIPLKCWVYTIH